MIVVKRFSLFKPCYYRNFKNILYVQKQMISGSKMLPENGSLKKFTIAVEGNIGSGKTTLLQYFSKFPEALVLEEPVDKWRNVEGYNLLDLMYKDPKNWSFTLQTYVQLTMMKQHSIKHTCDNRVKLMERSLHSARYCFVENLYKSQRLSYPNYIVLSEWFDFLIKSKDVHLDLIVYLQTKPETLFQRIQHRFREEEQCIPLEYLQALHELHENWLIHQQSFKVPCPVLVLDANCNLKEMENLFQKHENDLLFSKHEHLSSAASVM